MLGIFKIISKECTKADGEKFFAHALINPETKRKIDFRFKLHAPNRDLIQKSGKFKVIIDTKNMSYTNAYEYPRIYCDGIEGLAENDEELSPTLDGHIE